MLEKSGQAQVVCFLYYLKMKGPQWISLFQELFVEMIAKDALVYAQQGKRKTLQRKDLGKCCMESLNVFSLSITETHLCLHKIQVELALAHF